MNDDLIAVLDGRTVRIRPISPSDGNALVRFHEGLTDETTRMRFFRLHRHLTPSEIERFTHVDHHDREALVALDDLDIIAVGRFEGLPGTRDAEVAFVVADSWQGHGAGTDLLQQLARRAKEQGFTRLVADTLGENHRMLAIFRHSGLNIESNTEAGVVHVALQLDVPEPIAPVPGAPVGLAGVDQGQMALLEALEELRAGCLKAEFEFRDELAEVMPSKRASARNLVHYVALRRLDLRVVQEDLARLGLSSLGRSEAHVMGSLDAVIGVLTCLNGGSGAAAQPAESMEAHPRGLKRNAEQLLERLANDRATRDVLILKRSAPTMRPCALAVGGPSGHGYVARCDRHDSSAPSRHARAQPDCDRELSRAKREARGRRDAARVADDNRRAHGQPSHDPGLRS